MNKSAETCLEKLVKSLQVNLTYIRRILAISNHCEAQGEDECSFGSLYFALAARQMLLNNLACMPKFYYNYIEHLDRSRYEFREGAAAEAPRPGCLFCHKVGGTISRVKSQ